MQRRLVFSVFLVSVASLSAVSQIDSTRCSFFPQRILFTPLLANHEEPRLGVQQEIGTSRMRIGIGNMVDAVEYSVGRDTVRWGVDFFAYALSNDFKGARFQIDAADGFFGMHFVYANGSPLSLRFRIVHFSAHFVDGHYDGDNMKWRDQRNPVPFSRNYGELVAAYTINTAQFSVRLYSGCSYAAVVKPADIQPFTTIHGIEIRSQGQIRVYVADDFSLVGVPRYSGSNNIEAGVKFGPWPERGVRIFLNYFSGLDNFGQYYNIRKDRWGIGFTFDFW